MSPLVRKEIRMIFPPWCLAMLLAVLPIWLVWPATDWPALPSSPGALVWMPFLMGVVLLGVAPFGHELGNGTLPLLLAQPISREQLWRTKLVVIAAAFAFVLAALYLSIELKLHFTLENPTSSWGRNPIQQNLLSGLLRTLSYEIRTETLSVGVLGVLVSFAGGLWATLLFRHVPAALSLTSLSMIALAFVIEATVSLIGHELWMMTPWHWVIFSPTMILSVAFAGMYATAGCVWARQLFLRMEDTQWTGGIITLPALARARTSASLAVPARRKRPIRALFLKEIQLQQGSLILAAGFFALHVLLILFRHYAHDYVSSHRNVALALETVPYMWLLIPLVIGGTAVAEERKLGTLELSLCHPVAARTQWLVKLVVALFLGGVLGALPPLLIEQCAAFFGATSKDFWIAIGHETILRGAVLWVGSVVLAILAYYGSTLTRTTLHALCAGLLFSALALFFFAKSAPSGRIETLPLFSSASIRAFTPPILLGAVLVLSFINSKQNVIGASILRRNLLVLLLAGGVAVGASSAVYHRVWETWVAEEPAHHGASVHPAISPPIIETSWFRIAVLTAEGRLWLAQVETNRSRSFSGWNPAEPPLTVPLAHAGYVGHNQWKDVAVSEDRVYALREGSLLDITAVANGQASLSGATEFAPGPWRAIAGADNHFTGVKADGTLWEWGLRIQTVSNRVTYTKLPLPVQVGVQTDWIDVADSARTSVAVKSDATLWAWRGIWGPGSQWPQIERDALVPEKWLTLPGINLSSMSVSSSGAASIVLEDGTLWLGGYALHPLLGAELAKGATQSFVRFGTSGNWTQAHFPLHGGNRLIAVAKTGWLQQWNAVYYQYAADQTPSTHPSRYGIWTGCAPYGFLTYLTLGADGTLCCWRLDNSGAYYAHSVDRLMRPSRIKAKLVANLW